MHLVFENLDYSGLQFWSILSNFRCMLQHLSKEVGSPESSNWTPLARLIRNPDCGSSQQVEWFGQDGEWFHHISMWAFLWTTCTASKTFSHHHCYHPQSNHPFDYWPSIGFLQYHPFLPPAKTKASSYAWENWKVSCRQALDYSASRNFAFGCLQQVIAYELISLKTRVFTSFRLADKGGLANRGTCPHRPYPAPHGSNRFFSNQVPTHFIASGTGKTHFVPIFQLVLSHHETILHNWPSRGWLLLQINDKDVSTLRKQLEVENLVQREPKSYNFWFPNMIYFGHW